MTTLEHDHPFIDPVAEQALAEQAEATQHKDILNSYVYENPKLQRAVRVEVVSGNDYRIDAAHEIEVAGMVALGDPEDEVREEFAPHRESSIYFLAFAAESNGDSDDILGMGRIIPSSEAGGNKSLIDLASIPDWHADEVPEIEQEIDGNLRTLHSEDDVLAAFRRESGCDSLDEVWDIATMAPKLGLDPATNSYVADVLIASFTQETIGAWKNGDIKYVTSFNEQHAYGVFKHLGYPFHDLLGLQPMVYDSFISGEGMKAQIGWLSIEDLANEIRKRETRHMGVVATQASIQKALGIIG